MKILAFAKVYVWRCLFALLDKWGEPERLLMNQDVERTSLHEELKMQTKEIHEQLHVNPIMLPLLNPECSLLQYKRVLASFYCFYRWAEPRNRDFEQSPFEYEANASAWVHADIAAVSLEQTELDRFNRNIESAVLNAGDSASSVTTNHGSNCENHKEAFEAYLGFLYVKQGSLLGGQIIASALNKSLQLIPGETLFLFSGYQKKSKAMWQAFLEYLSSYSDHVDRNAVVESALQHFHVLKQILDTAYAKRNDYVF